MNQTNNPLADAKAIAKEAIVGVQAVCDKALNEVSGEVTKLEGDVLEVANSLVAGRMGPFSAIIMQVLQTGEATALASLEPKVKALIALLKTDADSALGHLVTKLA